MRNLNTSFAKNASRFFANEASNVLRETLDPAASLLRLVRSVLSSCSQSLLPHIYRQPALQYQPGTTVEQQTDAIFGRSKSAMSLIGMLYGGSRDGLRDCWSLDKG